MRSYQNSRDLYERACRCLAGGVSSEFRKNSHPHPLFFQSGRGSHVFDVDGNDFIDFTLSQGPLILGHSHPEVLEAVHKASMNGQLFAGQHIQELELAEQLQSLIPCAELVRFSLSGSEGIHAAIRLARGATGRPKFLRFEGHYHGWFDNVSVNINAPSAQALGSLEQPARIRWTSGLPEQVESESMVLPWNDLELVEKVVSKNHEKLAAIITEPIMCNNGCIPPVPGFLEGLRALCDRFGILLIFDEVITGFRLGMAGAQGFYDITPDLAVFGKALASGWPISVLAGKARWMRLIADGAIIHAGTMNSGQAGVAAALATLKVLVCERVHERLFSLGNRLMEGLRTVARANGQALLVQGPGPVFHVGFTECTSVKDFRGTFSFDNEKYKIFLCGMQGGGFRLIARGLWYVSLANTEVEIDHAITTAGRVLAEMNSQDSNNCLGHGLTGQLVCGSVAAPSLNYASVSENHNADQLRRSS